MIIMRLKNFLGALLIVLSIIIAFCAGLLIFSHFAATNIESKYISRELTDTISFSEPVNDDLLGSHETFLLYADKIKKEERANRDKGNGVTLTTSDEQDKETATLNSIEDNNSEQDGSNTSNQNRITTPKETLEDRIARQDSIFGGEYMPDRWYRANISDAFATTYDLLESGFRNFKTEIFVPTIPPDQILDAFDYVLSDNPDIFWMGYGFSYRKSVDGTQYIVYPDYIHSYDYVRSIQPTLEQEINRAVSYASSFSGQYRQAYAAMEWITKNCDTSRVTIGHQYIDSVFIEGVSCCSGYSHALQIVLQRLGIPCAYIAGTGYNSSGNSGPHSWCVMNINGTICCCDPMWVDVGSECDVTYFAVSDANFGSKHKAKYGLAPKASNNRYEIGVLSAGL